MSDGVQITVKPVETAAEYEAIRAVRLRVFIVEQQVPAEEEYDDLDATALHAIALVDGKPAATGRLVPHDEPGVARIGRMAVDREWRRLGVGGQVLRFLEDAARTQGYRQALLHAQAYVQAFYAAHGYEPQGDHFYEAGIEHVTMTKHLVGGGG